MNADNIVGLFTVIYSIAHLGVMLYIPVRDKQDQCVTVALSFVSGGLLVAGLILIND